MDPVQVSSLAPDGDGACEGGVVVVRAEDCFPPMFLLWILSNSLPLPLTVTPMMMPPITMLIPAITTWWAMRVETAHIRGKT